MTRLVRYLPMNPMSRLKNVLRGVTQRWGSSRIKQRIWNEEFASGRWDGIERTPEDIVYPFVEKYGQNGSILDLGCGSGNTSCEINAHSYQTYIGVDISDVALEKARSRSAKCGRNIKNHYAQGDIATYVPDAKHDVILFRESIYYLPKGRIKSTLDRLSVCLKPKGVFIVRTYEGTIAEELAVNVQANFTIVEQTPSSSSPAVLVFRPQRNGKSDSEFR